MGYGASVILDPPFADAVGRVRTALAEQGFGVLTEINVTAMLQARLGVQIEGYRILADLRTWTDPTEGRPD
jgi:uncharacterized protein (DUF302 family)